MLVHGAAVVGFEMYSYYVRELLASLALFTGVFFVLGLIGIGAFLIWCVFEKLAIWSRPASRNMIALSRRLIAAHAKS